MALVNKYNFVVWNDNGTPETDCSDEYVLPLVNGDEIKVYINFSTPITVDTSNYKIGWWVPSSIIIEDIATLNEDDIDGVNKNLYFTYTAGVLPRGLLRLVIYDTADSDSIVYWSNAFTYTGVSEQTSVIKYRNEFNILNFEFENLSDWYNKIRIHVRIAEPNKLSDVMGYEKSDGHFVYSLTKHRVTEEFQTQWFDRYMHEAFEAATTMTEIYFDDVRYERGLEADYSQQTPNKDFSKWLGTIRLMQYDYTAIAANS